MPANSTASALAAVPPAARKRGLYVPASEMSRVPYVPLVTPSGNPGNVRGGRICRFSAGRLRAGLAVQPLPPRNSAAYGAGVTFVHVYGICVRPAATPLVCKVDTVEK